MLPCQLKQTTSLSNMPGQYLVKEKNLDLNNCEFNLWVHIDFEDGSAMSFASSHVELQEDIIAIYTEHCGYHGVWYGSVENLRIFLYGFGGPVVSELFMEEDYPDLKLDQLTKLFADLPGRIESAEQILLDRES